MSIVSIIAAIGENRELGKDNQLLWHIPEDMQRFRTLTRGHPVIMGSKTFISIGKPLPGRTNIIITRDVSYHHPGCLISHSLQEAIEMAKKQIENDEIFIIGGGSIYEQAIPLADKLYLTVVKKTFVADTFFPEYMRFKTTLQKEEHDNGEYQFSFYELVP